MMAAAPAGVQDMIRTLYADESQRGALAAMLGPFGLTLDDLEAVLADG
jgi:hypothetical protein